MSLYDISIPTLVPSVNIMLTLQETHLHGLLRAVRLRLGLVLSTCKIKQTRESSYVSCKYLNHFILFRNANLWTYLHSVEPEQLQSELASQRRWQGGRIHQGERILGLLRSKHSIFLNSLYYVPLLGKGLLMFLMVKLSQSSATSDH